MGTGVSRQLGQALNRRPVSRGLPPNLTQNQLRGFAATGVPQQQRGLPRQAPGGPPVPQGLRAQIQQASQNQPTGQVAIRQAVPPGGFTGAQQARGGPGSGGNDVVIDPRIQGQQIAGTQQIQGAPTPPVSDGIPPPQLPQAPATGLIGSEQALQGALGGATQVLEESVGIGRGDIAGGLQGALGQLGTAQDQINAFLGSGQAALGQAGQQIGQQFAQGQQFLGQAGTRGQGLLTQAGEQAGEQFQQGIGRLDPFAQTGQSAQQRNAALSGALGAAAQQQAFEEFTASPGQAFLQEQGEQARLRSAAATGGAVGGNILKELTRFGQGIAAQDLQRQQQNLQQLGQQGLQAAGQQGQLFGQQAGLTGQLGQAGASLAGQIGQAQAGLSGQQAGLTGQLAGQQAQLFGQGAQQAGQFGQLGAGFEQTAGQNLANLAQGGGQNIANLISGIGQTVATGRTRAGEQIAGGVQGTTSALADLINQQGGGLSDIIGTGGTNLANLLAGLGGQQGASQEQLAALLSNLAVQEGSLGTQGPSAAAQLESGGILKDLGSAAGGAGALIKASDSRLKRDIVKIANIKGINIYRWNWNDIGKRIAGNSPTIGVIAQELAHIIPDAVMSGMDGYLRVNYNKVIKCLTA